MPWCVCQVNDTELLPALSTAFSEAEASGSHVGSFSTIFDDQKLNEEGGREQQAAKHADDGGAEPKGGAGEQQGAVEDPGAGEGGGTAASPKGEDLSAKSGAMRGMRAAAHQHASGGGGELPGSQVWHAVYSLWRG